MKGLCVNLVHDDGHIRVSKVVIHLNAGMIPYAHLLEHQECRLRHATYTYLGRERERERERESERESERVSE